MIKHTTTDSRTRFWQRHVDQWRRSGISQREYCGRHRLALSTFQLWRRRLAAPGVEAGVVDLVPVPPAARFVPAGPAPSLVISVHGSRYRIEVGEGVKLATLQVMLDALEER